LVWGSSIGGQDLFLFEKAREIELETGIDKKRKPLSVPVPNFTKCVHSKCTGTQLYQLCLNQSEIALEAGRAQDLGVGSKESGFTFLHQCQERFLRCHRERGPPRAPRRALGLWDWDFSALGSRVQELGLRVTGLWFRVWSPWFRV